jgi:NAD(P)-dependent dehydrogenase (short-subunit alcohol dehydrogenase family)
MPKRGEAVGRLVGKIALVTGGTSGIGAATVERMANEGAKVAFVGRNAVSGEALETKLGPSARFIRADVSREDEISRAVSETVSWGGRLDILFNNAGGLAPGGVDDFTAEDYDYAINLVLGSVLFGMKHAAPVMKAQRSGAIINNSSIAALRTHMGGYLYSVAKAGVSHATRLAGMELGAYGVTANCISPGAVATPLFFGGSRVVSHMRSEKLETMNGKLLQSLAVATPLARAGLPADVAAAVVFLASDEGRYINCHDLVVDGGLTAAGRSSFEAGTTSEPVGRRARL